MYLRQYIIVTDQHFLDEHFVAYIFVLCRSTRRIYIIIALKKIEKYLQTGWLKKYGTKNKYSTYLTP